MNKSNIRTNTNNITNNTYPKVSKKKRNMVVVTASTILLMLIIMFSAIVGGFVKFNNLPPIITPFKKVGNDNPTITNTQLISSNSTDNENSYNYEYGATTTVGYSGKIKGTVQRNLSVAYDNNGNEIHNYGDLFNNTAYPTFGSTLNSVIGTDASKVAARNNLIRESSYLTATGTSNAGGGGYNRMDENGYLYNNNDPALDTNGVHRKLYKHQASVGLYLDGFGGFEALSDDEPRIVKEVTMRPRGYSGYGVTGVYAPAGEVIKIEISSEDMDATGGIVIHIGQALYNGQANNIWAAKNQMQRIPHLLNTMVVNKNTATLNNGVYTAYVGSFIGGPLYIRNTNATFTATISGGVAYKHFILGYTTKEDFAESSKSTAPYFDLEVWNYGVLHSGPKYYARAFSYDDLYKVAILWEKISSVTTTGSSQGIVFLYDAFVAAGAAVAFPGRRSVNCPADWMSGSLNYNGLVSSGSWGNLHEYHHNFQGYGVGNGGEVTNNAMTLVSYALFTKISSKRGISSFGASGLGGWNNYTSATWALTDLLKIQNGSSPSNGNQGLSIYATLLHNFGANNFIQSKVQQQRKSYGESYQGYLRAWQDITHNDMTYFFTDVLMGLDNATASKWKVNGLPMFVPVSCVYQTGRSYMYDGEKKYFQTMQPYVIPFGEDFNIDLSRYETNSSGQYKSGSIVIPNGFTYKVKSISQPQYGSIELVDNFNIKYTPDGKNAKSGQIIVTLQIIKNDGAFKVDDVDLVLEFEQSHETNKTILKRTTYSYSAENMYTDARDAYNKNFSGYTNVSTANHSNPVQNSNTDIWFYPDTEENRKKYPNAPESFFCHPNTIEVLEGKLYFENEGTYRIYLRGRKNCAAYITYTDKEGNKQTKTCYVIDGSGANFYTNIPNTYVDISIPENSWVNVKEVLIVEQGSYIGLGYASWVEPRFTLVEKYYDENNEEVNADATNIVRTETLYYDNNGNQVSEEDIENAQPTPPTNSPSYMNAYRSDYEFPDNSSFESDYFYIRQYSYNYSRSHNDYNSQSIVNDPKCPSNYPIGNLFDGDLTTVCSSPNIVSASNPWEIVVDLGKTIEANRFILTGYKFNNANNKNQTPNSISLYVGQTLNDMKEVMSFDNGTVDNITLQFNFEKSTFRYYKLIVRHTVEGRFAAIANIEFQNSITGGTLITPDKKEFTYTGAWQYIATQATFGHVYVGNSNDSMTFKFTGTRLGILSSISFGKNFEVYIDGKKQESIDLIPITSESGVSYLSNALEKGTHEVVIKCLGETNIDSIVVF